MAAHNYEDLVQHVGHKLECVTYGDFTQENVAVECLECGCVIIDFDRSCENGTDGCPIVGQHDECDPE